MVVASFVAPTLASAQPAAPDHVAQPDDHTGPGEHDQEEAHGEGEHSAFSGLLWPTVNFAILVGVLYYFLGTPFSAYLRNRHDVIRHDLVQAEGLRSAAAGQLSEVDRQLQALPGELDALRARGAQEAAAEEQRIAQASIQERERLLEQTRREIDLQLRLARRQLTEHAANLAVQAATRQIGREITPADQSRLIDRYVDQVQPGGAR